MNIQSFRCKARPLRPRKKPQRSISRTFYANNRWLRRPGPWPGAGAVTKVRRRRHLTPSLPGLALPPYLPTSILPILPPAIPPSISSRNPSLNLPHSLSQSHPAIPPSISSRNPSLNLPQSIPQSHPPSVRPYPPTPAQLPTRLPQVLPPPLPHFRVRPVLPSHNIPSRPLSAPPPSPPSLPPPHLQVVSE